MLLYKQIYKDDEKLVQQLTSLWVDYMHEIYYEDKDVSQESDDTIINWLIDRVNVQGQRDSMHFECVFDDDNLLGFIFYAIDLGGIRGIIEAGFGYIMEMYVVPKARRKRFGTEIYEHAKENMIDDGAIMAYLTPDSKAGVPFWETIGFKNSGKIDPDNKMPIYVKEL